MVIDRGGPERKKEKGYIDKCDNAAEQRLKAIRRGSCAKRRERRKSNHTDREVLHVLAKDF